MIAATDSTIYHWGSITKTLTAIAILQLRDRGRLSLDDHITRYLPELRRVQAAGAGRVARRVQHGELGARDGDDLAVGERAVGVARPVGLRGGLPLLPLPDQRPEHVGEVLVERRASAAHLPP